MARERRRALAAVRLLVATAALLAPAPRAAAQVGHAAHWREGEAALSLSSAWPGGARRGFAPVTLELRNEGTAPLTFRISFSGNDFPRVTRAQIEIAVAPGASERRELLLPLFGAALDSVHCSGVVLREGVARGFQSEVGCAQVETAPLQLLAVTRTKGIDAEPRARGNDFPSVVRRTASSLGVDAEDGIARAKVTFCEAEALPEDAAAWTSLDAAIVDWDAAPPDPAATAALLAWVRLGGRAAFVGAGVGVEPLAQRIPGLAEWDEPRFEVENGGGYRVLRHGAGLVYLAGSPAWLDPAEDRAFIRWLECDLERIPLREGGDASRWPHHASLVDVGVVSARAGALVLLLFVVVIGPVNLFVAWRQRRPTLLLLSTPAIALVASVGFLGYGLLSAGLSIRVASRTLTLLDQRTHRAATREHRQLFASVVRGRGLRAAAGTAVSPFPPLCPEHEYFGYDDEWQDSFAVELGGERWLSGDFLPPRREVSQIVLREAAARERLELRLEDETAVVVNGLGADVVELFLRDAGGGFHLGRAIAAGATARLGKPSDDDVETAIPELWAHAADLLPALDDGLPPATYVARLARSPFADPTGLELREQEGFHVVVGILESAGEQRR